MSSKRLFVILVAVIVILGLGLLGGAYVLNGLLHKESKTLTSQRQQIAVLDGRQSGLEQAKGDIKKYQALADIAKSIVPQDKDQAQTIGEIVKLAGNNGVSLGSFTFPGSTLGATGTAGAAPALSQLTPVKGISGVYGLEITVQSATQTPTPYNNFLNFLQSLEQNRRTAEVTGITITPSANDPNSVTFTLTLQEYIKP